MIHKKAKNSRLEDIKDIAQALEQKIDMNTEVELLNKLWLSFKQLADKDIDFIKKHTSFRGYLDTILKKWPKYIVKTEKDLVRSAVSGDVIPPSLLKMEEYIPLSQELKLLKRDNNQDILVIVVGSGPFPETLIELMKTYDKSHFLGLDVDEEAVVLSKTLLSKFYKSASKNVSILKQDATLFDYSNADVIFLSNGLIGKKQILDQVCLTAPDNISVLTRNPIGAGAFLYEDVTSQIEQTCLYIESKIQASLLSMTYHLKKKSHE